CMDCNSLDGSVLVLDFFFSSRRRHTRLVSDWSSDVCSSDLQQGRSLTRGAQRLVTCPVVRQALLVGLEALPADVGRQLVADQHQAVLGTTDASACTGTPRLLTTGVRGPIAVAVGPRVERVVQQVLQCRA